MRFFVFALLMVALVAKGSPARALPERSNFLANLGQGMNKKADERYQSRWTLSDWFETQRKSRLQDQWLAGNKKDDLYEFYVGGRTGIRTVSVDGVEAAVRPRATQGLAAAYATLVGLEGAYLSQAGATDAETAQNSYGWDAFFAFRPLGDSMQNSNITLLYGLQFRDEFGGETVQNQTAKARLTFYLTKAFGIEGHYQWIFKDTSNQSAEIDGSAVEGGAFLDFSLLRIFGAWNQETRTRTLVATGAKSERKRQSIDVGLKIFF